MKVLCLAALLCGVSMLTAGATQAMALSANEAGGGVVVPPSNDGGGESAAQPVAPVAETQKKKAKKVTKKKKNKNAASSEKSEHEKAWSKVPDHTEASIASALRCSACIAVAYEVHHGLSVMDQFRHGACDRYELFETMENSCPRLVKDYGLYVEKRSPADVAEERKKARDDYNERQAKAIAEAEEKKKDEAASEEGGGGGALKPVPQPYEEPPATLAENYIIEFRSSAKFPTVLKDRWVKPMLSSLCGQIIDKHEKAILNGFKGVEYADFTRQLCIEWEGACEGAPVPPEEAAAAAAAARDEGTCAGAPPGMSDGRAVDDEEEMPEAEDFGIKAAQLPVQA